jgi:site-specific recombinase
LAFYIAYIFLDDLDDAKMATLYELFEDLADEHKRSNAIRRLPLTFAKGIYLLCYIFISIQFNETLQYDR